MTVSEAITRADTMTPNACPAQWKRDALALLDLRTLHGKLRHEAESDTAYQTLVNIQIGYTAENAATTVLQIPDPWAAAVYVPYLRQEIDRYSGDYDQAARHYSDFAQAYQDYAAAYNRSFLPKAAGAWGL